MAYQVKLEHFEGPLDLLLFLIKEHEVDIYDIPISLVTQQYLQYLELLKLLDLEVGSEYLLMAATLLRIKSKMLLPRRPEEDEEEAADPREELVQRLLEYRQFKEAAGVLNEHQDRNADVFYHPPVENWDEDLNGVETLDTRLAGNLNLWDLLQAFKFTLDRAKDDFDRTVERETVSIEDRMENILDSLKTRKNLFFSSLFEEDLSRSFLIITFLALLELIRQNRVVFEQTDTLGEIWLTLADSVNSSS
ncbi:MAG: segregation/condensation protein A [Gemmatimonadetes bacterium]|nr:segregation/condensation protein A [Gemmatimonadota bacterium]